MGFDAKGFEVFIASPSDVEQERDIIEEEVHKWNAKKSRNSQKVLVPTRWETNVHSLFGKSPQDNINEQIKDRADLLIAVFWTKLGTPTPMADSGTVQEIEEHVNAGKPAMLFFCEANPPYDHDPEQLQKIKDYKNKVSGTAHYQVYSDRNSFKDVFRDHLELMMDNYKYFQVRIDEQSSSPSEITATLEEGVIDANRSVLPSALNTEEKQLLRLGTESKKGTINKMKSKLGTHIFVGDNAITNTQDPRVLARWEEAVQGLVIKGLIKDEKGNGQIFRITNQGYQTADQIQIPNISIANQLSKEAKKLLLKASHSSDGKISILQTLIENLKYISINGETVTELENERERAYWKSALQELRDQYSLIEHKNNNFYEFYLTKKGYEIADILER